MREEEPGLKGMRLVVAYGAVGLLALTAIAVGIVNRGDRSPSIDLNATPTPKLSAEETPGHDWDVAQEYQYEDANSAKHDLLAKEILLENERMESDKEDTAKQENDPAVARQSEEEDTDHALAMQEEPEKAEESVAVSNPESILSKLSLSAESGMLWPVVGEQLIVFSPEHVVYHKTLDCYKTTDYVMLSSAAGSEVRAATEGIVTSVKEDHRLGNTVTMRVSNDHEMIYGLLSNVSVKEGDHIKEGTVIATVASPTKYYLSEGEGLYLKVTQNNQAIDPMQFLKEN